MCGIAGFWDKKNGVDQATAQRMLRRLRHRGPDDYGIWCDEAMGLSLAHTRLSIIDLSSSGRQPMTSPCGRLTLIFNGEIYNHLALRHALESEGGHWPWRGHSDTETLLAALRHWGVAHTLERLNGMFAFALWDKHSQTLHLARDRMGEKPLYYGINNGVFLFGSELKALTVHPQWQGEVDREALNLYLRFGYVPTPHSIYQGIKKLLPAHVVEVRHFGTAITEPACYWDIKKVVENRANYIQETDDQALLNHLDTQLRQAVSLRMMADVPLGAFLSGGIDSTTVVALMQAQSSRPVKTFSIGFDEEGYNEAKHAKAVAKYLGTEHTELYIDPEQALALVPRLPEIWDEPFSDSSQIPTYLVSQLARAHVTVSLSGDGGDEHFFGYDRYTQALQFKRLQKFCPELMRCLAASLMAKTPVGFFDWLGGQLPGRLRIAHLGDRLRKLGEIFNAESPEAFYRQLVSHWKHPETAVIGGADPRAADPLFAQSPKAMAFDEWMMLVDSHTYLPDDILTKVDRASMAVSLEARVPFLDHHFVEFAWGIPMRYKFRGGKRKWLLRELLYTYVPREFMERPKKGFGVPIEAWLRGPLREWAESLLNEKRLREEGFFNPQPIKTLWQEHLSGKRRWHYLLWEVLMFQAWLDKR